MMLYNPLNSVPDAYSRMFCNALQKQQVQGDQETALQT
jgi:hypothetical protein